jgi:hypothetical protein
MNIAIIGGGFYGFHLADQFLSKNKNLKIDIYEKESNSFTGAFTNNQHRLHLGYHYPRSIGTIVQSINNYNKFFNLYKNFIKIPKYNIYSIHEDSIVNFDEYIKIYENFNLNFKIINNLKLKEITNNKIKTNKIISSLKTEEATVNYNKISEYLKEKLNNKINLFLNNEILNIPNNYDITINATYNYPNLFLKNKIETKQELCCLLLANNVLNNDIGITIMDGLYCSIFPHHNQLHSLSSVKETPFLKYKDLEKKFSKEEIKYLYNKLNVKEKILDDINQFIYIDKNQIVSELLSIKTKFNEDSGDTREAIWKKEGSHYSIFCGKISAICTISEEIIDDIGI